MVIVYKSLLSLRFYWAHIPKALFAGPSKLQNLTVPNLAIRQPAVMIKKLPLFLNKLTPLWLCLRFRQESADKNVTSLQSHDIFKQFLYWNRFLNFLYSKCFLKCCLLRRVVNVLCRHIFDDNERKVEGLPAYSKAVLIFKLWRLVESWWPNFCNCFQLFYKLIIILSY